MAVVTIYIIFDYIVKNFRLIKLILKKAKNYYSSIIFYTVIYSLINSNIFVLCQSLCYIFHCVLISKNLKLNQITNHIINLDKKLSTMILTRSNKIYSIRGKAILLLCIGHPALRRDTEVCFGDTALASCLSELCRGATQLIKRKRINNEIKFHRQVIFFNLDSNNNHQFIFLFHKNLIDNLFYKITYKNVDNKRYQGRLNSYLSLNHIMDGIILSSIKS